MGAVCRYLALFAALNLVLTQGPVFGDYGEVDPGHIHHGDTHVTGMTDGDFDAFLTLKIHALNNDLNKDRAHVKNSAAIISYIELQDLVSLLLKKLNCDCEHRSLESETTDSANCSVCSSVLTGRVFNVTGVNREDGVNKEQFTAGAVVILAALSSDFLSSGCEAGGVETSVEDYITSLTGEDSDRLSRGALATILSALDESYTPETLAKCFDAELLLNDVADSSLGATRTETPHIAANILAYMVEGYCIGPAAYVDPALYVQDVVDQYGEGGVISLEKFENVLEDLGIGGHGHHGDLDEHGHDEHGHDEDHEEHEGHVHRRSVEILSPHTCFSAEELLFSYGLDPARDLDQDHISLVCPALLQQQLSGVCSEDESVYQNDVNAYTYFFGVIAVFVISLCAILGGLLIPLLTDENRELVLGMLIAMAVSTLVGDAIIHLIPLATGLHTHESHGHDHDSHEDMDYIWKTFLTLMSLYAFFLFEAAMSFVSPAAHSHKHGHTEEEHSNRQMIPLSDKSHSNHSQRNEATEDGVVPDQTDGGGNQTVKVTKFGSLPVMILLSDTFHNFCDGLAIGASFSANLGTGLSTSIAVFCHELPHELGDLAMLHSGIKLLWALLLNFISALACFVGLSEWSSIGREASTHRGDLAMLLKSGIKLKWALLLNFISALTCFVGFFIGVVIGGTLVVRQWILSITAGMFIYVGLVDMMPQILHAEKSKSPLKMFVLHNVGFLIGAFAMLCISFFESSVTFRF